MGKTTLGRMQKAAKVSVGAEAMRDYLKSAREVYLGEIKVLAEELRPRFESGELHAMRDSEHKDGAAPGEQHWASDKVEAACASRFGLEVVEDRRQPGVARYNGDEVAAYVVLACSPSAIGTNDNWTHVCYHAANAASWDVIHNARRAGWYRPTRDEVK